MIKETQETCWHPIDSANSMIFQTLEEKNCIQNKTKTKRSKTHFFMCKMNGMNMDCKPVHSYYLDINCNISDL